MLSLEDEVFQFRRRYEDKFSAFTAEHADKVNIFVVIEYSEAHEVSGIFEYLTNLHHSVPIPFGIHFAKDRDWFDELHNNLMFYMIACHAGMAFFTSANFVEKELRHNPNVIYEFGL